MGGEDGRPGVTLLQGVTGSGKTLVYIRLAQTLLAQDRSVMILVPEIALTPQMMARFSAYFGDEVALLHSGQSGDYRGMPTAAVAVLTLPATAVIEPGAARLSAFWWP